MFANKIYSLISTLFPGYFALVMATGIVSIASFLLGFTTVAWILLIINLIAYPTLWLFTLGRMLWYRNLLWNDVQDHARGAGFFTLVASSCVLGAQLIVVAKQYPAALFLWGLGCFLWFVVMYTFFTAVTIRPNKPTLETGINGAWLIAAVATQSVSVLGTLLSGHYTSQTQLLLFFTLCMYLLGCMLYLSIITLIFYRLTFIPLSPNALTPPYWINMGAVAITCLAGSVLILNAQSLPLLQELLPFLKGFTLFFWVAGTWWIPLLLFLGAWRHIYQKVPLVYDPQYWGMVFPLGMYTTCTIRLSQALELPFLMVIPQVFLFLALAAWGTAFVGLMKQLVKGLFSTPQTSIT